MITLAELVQILPEFLTVSAVAVSGIWLTQILLRTLRGYADEAGEAVLREGLTALRTPLLACLLWATVVIASSIPDGDYLAPEPLRRVAVVALIAAAAWACIRGSRVAMQLILTDFDVSQKDNLVSRKMATQLRVLHRIFVTVVIIVAGAMILMSFDSVKRIGLSLLASAGVAGIVIGLAAQKVLGNVLAGIQLAIAQPIRLDDVVIMEGEWGWIEEITLTYVVVRIWDKRRLIVPSSCVLEKPFQNWTRTSAEILGTVFIYCDYTVDVTAIRAEVGKILERCPHWDGQVNNTQVTNATAQTLEVRVLMSAADSPTAWNLRVFVREEIVKFLQHEFPEALPRTRVELKSPDHAFPPESIPI